MDPYKSDGGAQRSVKLPDLTRVYLPFIEAVAERGDMGAEKYGESNYRLSATDPDWIRQLFSHAIAHLICEANYYERQGYFRDPTLDSEGDELAAAAWGLMALFEARDACVPKEVMSSDIRDVHSGVPDGAPPAGPQGRLPVPPRS
jgi:hypothetical protein